MHFFFHCLFPSWVHHYFWKWYQILFNNVGEISKYWCGVLFNRIEGWQHICKRSFPLDSTWLVEESKLDDSGLSMNVSSQCWSSIKASLSDVDSFTIPFVNDVDEVIHVVIMVVASHCCKVQACQTLSPQRPLLWRLWFCVLKSKHLSTFDCES
jgi:hypothetical protein